MVDVDSADRRPLIAHVIHRLAIGGLENGLVNLLNTMSVDHFRHVIICMTDYTDFVERIQSKEIKCYALNKKPGQDFHVYFRLYKLLRKLKPDILHTRNLGTLECVLPAKLAGVKYCIHGEHGRDMSDIDGSNRRYIMLRRFFSLWVDRFIALSKDLQMWLIDHVKISPNKIVQLYNGVDTQKYIYRDCPMDKIEGLSQIIDGKIVLATVGRLSPEKDQFNLIYAYRDILVHEPKLAQQCVLLIIGDGALKEEMAAYIHRHELNENVYLLGKHNNVSDFYNCMNLFVLPSLGEGISNTILEAMSSSVTVVATSVGGNVELVVDHETGRLVPPSDPQALADTILYYLRSPELIKLHGKAGRARVENYFSLAQMVASYENVYCDVLGVRQRSFEHRIS